jgi:hypothetical protein
MAFTRERSRVERGSEADRVVARSHVKRCSVAGRTSAFPALPRQPESRASRDVTERERDDRKAGLVVDAAELENEMSLHAVATTQSSRSKERRIREAGPPPSARRRAFPPRGGTSSRAPVG